MPTYQVTDPQTGLTVRLTGDSPPTEAELEQIFANLPQAQTTQPQEGGFLDEVVGGLETAGTILSGAIAEPAAGIAGLATGALTQDPAAAASVVEGVRDRLTLEPETPEAQRNIAALGEAIAPAAEAFGAAEDFLGETTLEATGSPALAAAAKTIPTALLEVAGAGLASKVSRVKSGKALDDAIREAAPSAEQLRQAGGAVFDEISELGVTIEPKQFTELLKRADKAARDAGGRPRTTPQVFGVIDEFAEVAESGRPIDLDEIDQMRRVAQNAADTIDRSQKVPALAIIDEIDTFLDDAGDKFLTKPEGVSVGEEYRRARQLWGRARKSEAIDELFVAAQDTASGFENGLRIEARKLLKNKKRSKFFSAKEKEALKQISQGTKASNLAKLVGRLGLTEGQAVNIVNPAIGGGAAFALFGTPGAIAVPAIGQVSKGLAQRLTKNNARLADQVVRAGSNAELITKAYLNNVPKGQRSALELSELLMRNEVDLGTVKSAFAKDAADVARQRRALMEGAAAGGILSPDEEEN